MLAAASGYPTTTRSRSNGKCRAWRLPLPSSVEAFVTHGMYWPTAVNGVTEDFLEGRDWPLAGRNFDPDEVNSGAKLVLLGATVARTLFGESDPIGAVVRLKKVPHTVIGVLGQKGHPTPDVIRTMSSLSRCGRRAAAFSVSIQSIPNGSIPSS